MIPYLSIIVSYKCPEIEAQQHNSKHRIVMTNFFMSVNTSYMHYYRCEYVDNIFFFKKCGNMCN